MPDLASLIRQMRRNGDVNRIARDPLAQFGTATRRYIGAEILPERPVEFNSYTEEQVRYRTVIANAGTRYSPTQKKKGVLVGSFDVKLAESDIASELTSREYDALRRLAIRGSLDAVASATNFLERTVQRPLIEWNERARWQAIVNALVQLRGDNKYQEDVAYSNPTGHRINVGGDWDTDTYDPFDDIFAMADFLAGKGVILRRIIAGSTVISKMAGNDKVKQRTGNITINVGASLAVSPGRGTLAQINGVLQGNGLPAIERYDLQYRTQTGSGFFLPRDVMVFIGESDIDESIVDEGDVIEIVPSVLGYVGVGVAAGQDTPGRVVRAETKDDKPPRVQAEGWQTSLPVILEPESMGVLKNIV